MVAFPHMERERLPLLVDVHDRRVARTPDPLA